MRCNIRLVLDIEITSWTQGFMARQGDIAGRLDFEGDLLVLIERESLGHHRLMFDRDDIDPQLLLPGAEFSVYNPITEGFMCCCRVVG